MSYCVYTNELDMTNIEIKGSLARLLATENLVVEHKQVATASFDVSKRVLTLPMWTKASDIVYNMLVGHEVGHALYTPNDEEVFTNAPCPLGYINVTEDARIEKLMKRKYPGLSKDFHGGYSELHEDDFFSVEDTDLNQLTLIDRVNLHYKIGAYALMPFSPAEAPLRDAVGRTETFQEAIDAAKAIYDFMKAQQTEEEKQQEEEQQQQVQAEVPAQGGGQGEDQSVEELMKELYPDFPGGEDQSEGKQDEQPANSFSHDVDTPDNQMQPSNKHGENTNQGYGRPSIEVVHTQNSFDYNASDLADRGATEIKYATFPSKIAHEDIIVPASKIWKAAELDWQGFEINPALERGDENPFIEVDRKFVEFSKQSSKDVNFMVKEFECKKAASAYSRQSIAKTGVLDTAKLHTYKFNDDVFKKVTRTPDGKNHGLVFLVDWSGSMSGEIYETILQIINLCQFCKKVGIPFDVYSFVVDGGLCLLHKGLDHMDPYYDRGGEESNISSRAEGEFFLDRRFRYGNLLTSDVNQKTFNHHCKLLYRVANYYRGSRDWTVTRPKPPTFMGLGGTPLNEALVVMQSYLGKWKSQHNVEKCHLIVLTDGEAQCLPTTKQGRSYGVDTGLFPDYGHYNTVIRHKGRHFKTIHNANSEMTQRLLEIIRETNPGSNVLGIRICPGRGFAHYLRYLGIWDQRKIEKVQKQFKKKRCAVINNTGYNELYVIASNSYSEDTAMEVEADATKTEIKRAFAKSLKSKSVNRNLLSSFVGQIA